MIKHYNIRKQICNATNRLHTRVGLSLLLLLCFTSTISVFVSADPTKIKNGDWIQYGDVNTGNVPFTTQTVWTKVEFLDVSESTMTIQVKSLMTNGTEINGGSCVPPSGATIRINVGANSKSSGDFSGFVIPIDLNVGDVFRVSDWGNVTITGETTRTYAGASRTVVYAPYSYDAKVPGESMGTISYWDKQTGIFVEETHTTASYTMSFKAIQTNIWTADSGGFSWQLLGIIAVLVAGVIAVTAFMMRRRKHSITVPSQNELRS